MRWLPLGCLGAAGLVSLGAVRSMPSVWRVLAPKLLMLVMALLGVCLAPRARPVPLPPPGPARLVAQVEAVAYGANQEARSRIRVLSGVRLSDGVRIPAGARLWARPFALPEGARVTLLANLQPSAPFRNDSPHPPLRAASPTRGVAKLPAADAYDLLDQPLHARWVDGIRSFTRARLSATLAPDVSAVARSLLLGDAEALDENSAEDVRASGLSHVFAVSGMHVTLLAGLSVWTIARGLSWLPWCARAWNVPRLAAGLGIPLALSIAALTGGAPSAWRASITTAIAWLVIACGREPDAAAVTAAAAILFGALTPAEALRPAFLLSIAATAAIVGPRAGDVATALGTLRELTLLTLRSSLATAPIVWWVFGSLPLVGVLANLLLVPVGSLLLLLAAAHAAFACALPVLAPLSAAGLSVSARAFLQGCAAFAGLDPQLTLPVLSLAQGLCLSAGVCFVLFAGRRRTQLTAAGVCLGVCLLAEWQLRRSEKPEGVLRATFLDVGQGDSALLDLPDGRALLIDAGGALHGGADPGERAILPLLAARRRSEVQTAVLTHPHPDHYGGLAALLGRVKIREFWDSGQSADEGDMSATSQRALELANAARARGARVLHPQQLCGAPRAFGAASIEVIWPCPAYDPGHDPNDNSLVLRVTFAGRRLLFTGDIEAHAETGLVSSGRDLRADVLKVPHHGSRSSSSPGLLEAVRPSLAIISRGAANSFGHPHPEVLSRLQAHVPHVVDLGVHGGASVLIDASGKLQLSVTEP